MVAAVFGGSFDPLTNAHVGVISALLESGEFDEVWVVPCGGRKEKELVASPTQRLVMCHLAIEECFAQSAAVKVLDVDIHEGKESMGTLALSRQLPGDCEYVIGSDLAQSLSRWSNAEMLMEEVRFVVVPRPGHRTTALPPCCRLLPGFETSSDVSSTAVRRLLGEGATSHEGQDAVRILVPSVVFSFFTRYKIYTSG